LSNDVVESDFYSERFCEQSVFQDHASVISSEAETLLQSLTTKELSNSRASLLSTANQTFNSYHSSSNDVSFDLTASMRFLTQFDFTASMSDQTTLLQKMINFDNSLTLDAIYQDDTSREYQ